MLCLGQPLCCMYDSRCAAGVVAYAKHVWKLGTVLVCILCVVCMSLGLCVCARASLWAVSWEGPIVLYLGSGP